MTVVIVLAMVVPVMASPPFPEPEAEAGAIPAKNTGYPLAARQLPSFGKTIDQPNAKDYLRIRERQRLLKAGQTAEANALALSGTDRVLVILVEFAGTDVFTWTAGVSTWDPRGIADPNEAVYDASGNVVVGDCSKIITQTTVFTYTGPLHNMIMRPISSTDRSADTIWTEDFDPEWLRVSCSVTEWPSATPCSRAKGSTKASSASQCGTTSATSPTALTPSPAT